MTTTALQQVLGGVGDAEEEGLEEKVLEGDGDDYPSDGDDYPSDAPRRRSVFFAVGVIVSAAALLGLFVSLCRQVLHGGGIAAPVGWATLSEDFSGQEEVRLDRRRSSERNDYPLYVETGSARRWRRHRQRKRGS